MCESGYIELLARRVAVDQHTRRRVSVVIHMVTNIITLVECCDGLCVWLIRRPPHTINLHPVFDCHLLEYIVKVNDPIVQHQCRLDQLCHHLRRFVQQVSLVDFELALQPAERLLHFDARSAVQIVVETVARVRDWEYRVRSQHVLEELVAGAANNVAVRGNG